MKIKTLIEVICFLFFAYTFFPSYNGFLSYIFKLIFYVLLLTLFSYYLNEGLNYIEKMIKNNYVQWYQNLYESKHNTIEEFKQNNLVKKNLMLIYNSITNRRKYYYLLKHMTLSNKIGTIIFIFFVIIFILIVNMIVF